MHLILRVLKYMDEIIHWSVLIGPVSFDWTFREDTGRKTHHRTSVAFACCKMQSYGRSFRCCKKGFSLPKDNQRQAKI